MLNRYAAIVESWDGSSGQWSQTHFRAFKTKARAELFLSKQERYYTRYERHPDFGFIVDLKKKYMPQVSGTENMLSIDWSLPTVGDLGWTP